MKRATATIGVLMLAACDFGARDVTALRAELAAKEAVMADLRQEVARLREALASEHQLRLREAAARASSLDEAVVEVEEPRPPVDLSFPEPAAGDATGIVCAANRCTVPRKTFEALVGDPERLSQQGRIIPYLKDGQPRGFRLSGMRPGSVFLRVGLENGDRVTALGGLALGGVDEALAAFAEFKRQGEWTIAGVRRGAPFELKIVIAG